MLVIKHTDDLYTIECNACGRQLKEQYPDESRAKVEALARGYVELGELHYCPKCWKGFLIGEGEAAKGIVVTADMKVWDDITGEEIKPVIG